MDVKWTKDVTVSKCPCGDRWCDEYLISTQRSAGFDKADADLYAAAPDMADALAPVADMAMWTESAADDEAVILTVGTVRKMRAALRKARGE